MHIRWHWLIVDVDQPNTFLHLLLHSAAVLHELIRHSNLNQPASQISKGIPVPEIKKVPCYLLLMLALERAQCLRDIVWNADNRGNAGRKALSYYVECWNHTGMTSAHPDVYWRDGWLGNVDPEDGQLGPGDEELGMWVRREVSGKHSMSAPAWRFNIGQLTNGRTVIDPQSRKLGQEHFKAASVFFCATGPT